MAAFEFRSHAASAKGAPFLTAATVRERRDAPVVHPCHAGQDAHRRAGHLLPCAAQPRQRERVMFRIHSHRRPSLRRAL